MRENTQSSESVLFAKLRRFAESTPEAAAILSPKRRLLSFKELYSEIQYVVETVNDLNIGVSDRVALVLPSGPEAALAMISFTSCVTCAPLNHQYTAEEFEFALTDFGIKAVVTLAGLDSPVRLAARKRGIPIIELMPELESPAGVFKLFGKPIKRSDQVRKGFATLDDVAFVLHTSGTTSRPKIVPISHLNIVHGMSKTSASLGLGPKDRSLNVMPLFHVHGIVGATFSPLSVGGSVICTQGFVATQFFDWMEELRPTWYTAVPTIHQSILSRARIEKDRVAKSTLRIIRSTSAAIPIPILKELEDMFRVPVIENWGMTEFTPLASNPLPPKVRKPGSVGVPEVPIAIVDENGKNVPPETTGEIVVRRGPYLMAGYENNPAANEVAFNGDWFRTGDQGYLDAEGYLYISGRLKEVINRAGEKVNPLEVENVLHSHPAVMLAVVFSVPDEILGETVGAAVVLRPGGTASVDELLDFAAARLSDYKIPKYLEFFPDIPRGATGKFQRIGMAARLGIGPGSKKEIPVVDRQAGGQASQKEAIIGKIWKEVLKLDNIGRTDDFFKIGGDSILGTVALTKISEEFGIQLALRALYAAPTIRDLAVKIDNEVGKRQGQESVGKITKAERPGPIDVSPIQEHWIVLGKRNISNLTLQWSKIPGELNVERFISCVQSVVSRHEIFRAYFKEEGGAVRQFIGEPVTLEVPYVDIHAMGEEKGRQFLTKLIDQELSYQFNLEKPPLCRVFLIKLGSKDHRFLVNFHHAICDYWSKCILNRDIMHFYSASTRGVPPSLPNLSVQYADFASWHRKSILADDFDRKVSFWKERLKGNPTVSILQNEEPQPVSEAIPYYWEVPKNEFSNLKKVASKEGVSMFSLFLTSFLSVWQNEFRPDAEEFLFDTPASTARNRPELFDVIGPMAMPNSIKIRPPEGVSFIEFVRNIHDAFLSGNENLIPGPLLNPHVPADRKRPRMVINQLNALSELTICPPEISIVNDFHRPYERLPSYPLEVLVQIFEHDDGRLLGNFIYNVSRFGKGSAIKSFVDHLKNVLTNVANNPERILTASFRFQGKAKKSG